MFQRESKETIQLGFPDLGNRALGFCFTVEIEFSEPNLCDCQNPTKVGPE